MDALEAAGFSADELSECTLVPQTLGQMFALEKQSATYKLLDEIVSDVSISEINEASKQLADDLFAASAAVVDFPLRDAYFSTASASEAVIACLASVAFRATFSETCFIACSASSTVARGMSHVSEIAKVAHSEAGWRVVDIPCQRLPRERGTFAHSFVNAKHRPKGVRQLAATWGASRSSALLISARHDAQSQMPLLARAGRTDVRLFRGNYPTESTNWDEALVEGAAFLVDKFLRRKPGVGAEVVAVLGSHSVPVPRRVYRAALIDVVSHHLTLNQTGLVGHESLTHGFRNLKQIFVGRGTPSRRVLIEFLAESGFTVYSMPHGVGEGFCASSSNVHADLHYLPTVESLVRHPGQAFAPQYFDNGFVESREDFWKSPGEGVLLVMTDIPYGGAWPAWSWGVAEYGDALVAIASAPALSEFARLRERPSDPNRIGRFLLQRRGIRLPSTQAHPGKSTLLLGIGYRGSLLLEATAHGRRSGAVVGRLCSSPQQRMPKASSVIPSISATDLQQLDDVSALKLHQDGAFWGERHPLHLKPLGSLLL